MEATKLRTEDVNSQLELVVMSPGKLVKVKVVDPISEIVRREQVMMMYRYIPNEETVELVDTVLVREKLLDCGTPTSDSKNKTYHVDLVWTKQLKFENGVIVYNTLNSHWSYGPGNLNQQRIRNLCIASGLYDTKGLM